MSVDAMPLCIDVHNCYVFILISPEDISLLCIVSEGVFEYW